MARWRGTPLLGDVDDALQEVFVDLLNGELDRVDPERPFRPFLFGVARIVALRTEERRERDRDVRLESEHARTADNEMYTGFQRLLLPRAVLAARRGDRVAATSLLNRAKTHLKAAFIDRDKPEPQLSTEWRKEVEAFLAR